MNCIDTHAHLFMLNHSPLEDILSRAQTAGITKMVSVSTDHGSWESNRNLAHSLENVFYTLGLHPHEATWWPECAPELDQLFVNGIPPKCVGIGEMGLDFHYNFSPPEVQKDVCEAQLILARRAGLPVILHCRESFKELYEMIRRLGLSPKRGVMHCFTGGVPEAREALELGLKISFSGILTFKNADRIREAAKFIPLTEMLIETDCPFLSPVPFRGKPNEPSFLIHTLNFLATTLGKEPSEIAPQILENSERFFEI